MFNLSSVLGQSTKKRHGTPKYHQHQSKPAVQTIGTGEREVMNKFAEQFIVNPDGHLHSLLGKVACVCHLLGTGPMRAGMLMTLGSTAGSIAWYGGSVPKQSLKFPPH